MKHHALATAIYLSNTLVIIYEDRIFPDSVDIFKFTAVPRKKAHANMVRVQFLSIYLSSLMSTRASFRKRSPKTKMGNSAICCSRISPHIAFAPSSWGREISRRNYLCDIIREHSGILMSETVYLDAAWLFTPTLLRGDTAHVKTRRLDRPNRKLNAGLPVNFKVQHNARDLE